MKKKKKKRYLNDIPQMIPACGPRDSTSHCPTDSCRNDQIPEESTEMSLNDQILDGNRPESAGIHRNIPILSYSSILGHFFVAKLSHLMILNVFIIITNHYYYYIVN